MTKIQSESSLRSLRFKTFVLRLKGYKKKDVSPAVRSGVHTQPVRAWLVMSLTLTSSVVVTARPWASHED